MTSRRLMRYQSTQGLAEGVAHRLVQTIVRIQAAQERIDLCLTGGRIANIVCRYGRRSRMRQDSSGPVTRLVG